MWITSSTCEDTCSADQGAFCGCQRQADYLLHVLLDPIRRILSNTAATAESLMLLSTEQQANVSIHLQHCQPTESVLQIRFRF